MSEPTVCRHCGYFINYVIPKAPAEPGWVHMPYTPTKPTGPHCDHPEPNDIDHTHPGDGTVPGLHGEPIPTPVLGCPACATVHSIGDELGAAPVQTAPNRRKIRTGETFDLAPHEVAEVVDERHGVLWTIDGGPGGMQGARIG